MRKTNIFFCSVLLLSSMPTETIAAASAKEKEISPYALLTIGTLATAAALYARHEERKIEKNFLSEEEMQNLQKAEASLYILTGLAVSFLFLMQNVVSHPILEIARGAMPLCPILIHCGIYFAALRMIKMKDKKI